MSDTTYRIRLAGTGAPLEIAELVDGTEVSRNIHSSIGRKLHGLLDLAGGLTSIDGTDTATKELRYIQYTTTTVEAILEYAITSEGLGAVTALIVAIVEAGSTGTPDCLISLDGTNFIYSLSGVGDHIIARLDDLAGNTIKFKSSGATELAIVDILVMYETSFLREVASRNLMTSADEFLRVGSA